MPTVSEAVVRLFVAGGSPAMEAPSWTTPPLSRPLGPLARAGEPGSKLNQSRMTCACSQLVKAVSDNCGMYFSSGGLVEFPPPAPLQTNGSKLFEKVTVALVQLRISFSASTTTLPS